MKLTGMQSFICKYLPIVFGLSLVLAIVAMRAIAYLVFGQVGDRVASLGILVATVVFLLVLAQRMWTELHRT